MMQIQDGNRPTHRAMMVFRDEQAPAWAVGGEQTPGWALGLRQLYQGVAEEPIPADFDDLLARLDDRSARGSSH